jgi:hypothetical protein
MDGRSRVGSEKTVFNFPLRANFVDGICLSVRQRRDGEGRDVRTRMDLETANSGGHALR